MYVYSSVCKSKRGKDESFRTDSIIRQGCVMSPSLFIDRAIKENRMGLERMRRRFQGKGEEGDYLVCSGLLVLCG